MDAQLLHLVLSFTQPLHRRVFQVGHRATVQNDYLGLVLVDERPHQVSYPLHIGKVEHPFSLKQQHPGEDLIVWMLRASRTEDVGARLAAKHKHWATAPVKRQRKK